MLDLFLILGRATYWWTRDIDIPSEVILILDAVVNRDELLVTLLLGDVFISLHCCSEWRLDVII